MSTVLKIENFSLRLKTDAGYITPVNDVSLSLIRQATTAVVGESGCGKSMLALSILGLIPESAIDCVRGNIHFRNYNLLDLDKKSLTQLRGNAISMIFQEPMTALNPVYTIGDQISESFRFHRGMNRMQAKQAAIEMLKQVGMAEAKQRYDAFPHHFSGGMRQRAMIAMALACEPEILIADEPTTALDVTIQAQIMALITKLQQEKKTAVMLITHDLSIVAQYCHHVVVMYAGRVVEAGAVESVFRAPLHPYTKGLLNSLPRLEHQLDLLETIDGSLPPLTQMPEGCAFHPRCPIKTSTCTKTPPLLSEIQAKHQVACFHPLPMSQHGT